MHSDTKGENMDFMTEEEARKLAEKNLDNVLDKIDTSILFPGVEHYSGKVRENFILPDAHQRVMVTTDRVSVFDSVVGTVPFKGQVLDEIAQWWFEHTGPLVHNHVKRRTAPVLTVAEQCQPLKVEMVVRVYLTGTSPTSIWTAYKDGLRDFCGNHLPEEMEYNQRLPFVMVTPTTKAEYGQHDENVSPEQILNMGLLLGSRGQQGRILKQLINNSLVLFGAGSAIARQMGLILVDTKYEFGINRFGEIILIDEIHTPDSSRYWEQDDYVDAMEHNRDPISLSKQLVRDQVIKQGYDPKVGGTVPMLDDEGRVECAVRYMMLSQRITGERFEPDTRNVEERIIEPLREMGVMRK